MSIVTPPPELVKCKQWVCFTSNKVPYSPGNGAPAKADDPSTWEEYTLARAAWIANSGFYAGIGREFLKEQEITGIDIDDGIDANGDLTPFARSIVEHINSYTEVSPSGRGLHIWVYGSIPDNIGADPDGLSKIEMYDHGRYFTWTGKHLSGTPATMERRQEELTALHAEVRQARREAKQAKRSTDEQAAPGTDSAYGRKALQEECRNVALAWEGGRNEQLNRSAFALGQLIGGDVLSRSTVERELYDAALAAGLAHSEIVKTLRSGIDAGIAEPRTPPAKEMPRYHAESSEASSGNGNGHHPTEEVGETHGSFNRTDLGNAERFKAHYGDRVRWCEDWKSWLVWSGRCWERDRSGQVDRFAKATVRSIYAEAAGEPDEAERKRIAKHAIASESSRAVRALLDRAKSELPAVPDEFNRHLHLINCVNGTLDLRTGELRPHQASDMLTRCLKIAYNPLATCERWQHFISSIFAGEQALIEFMRQALGMSLSGDVSEQCLFICHGAGSNGKTTLLETVRIILGAYGLAANIETFQLHKGEHITNDVAELYGARLVTASENTLGSRLNEAFIKKATGNEPLRARRLHENEFQFMPEFTIWFAVNHKPVVKDTSKGMWRRVHFIPFTVTVEGDQIDKRLGEKLLAESEGILAWLVQGCLAWYRQGRLIAPEIVQEATQAYRAEMDVIGRFLSERCQDQGEIGAAALYDAYKQWCEGSGERWENKMVFGLRLAERGYQKSKTRSGIVYSGLSLLPVDEDVNTVNTVNTFSDNSREESTQGENYQKSIHKYSQYSQDDETTCAMCGEPYQGFYEGRWLCERHYNEARGGAQ